MLAFKSSEYFSLFRYFNVIYALSVVLIIVLLNGNSQISALVTDQIETETKFAPEHIEKSCVEKCPDQVSGHFLFFLNYVPTYRGSEKYQLKIIACNFFFLFLCSTIERSLKCIQTKFYRYVNMCFFFSSESINNRIIDIFLFSPASLYMHELSDLLLFV